MIFNQFEFIFLFMPVVLALFFVPLLRGVRREILLLASLFFYGVSGLEHLFMLASGMCWIYVWTRSDKIVANGIRLTVAIAPPALALFYYKYTTFFIRDVLGLSQHDLPQAFDLFHNVVLPAGISFFTFELISYAIDRYRGEIKAPVPFRTFALFISFFPHLVAGPILRFHQMAKPIAALREFRLQRSEATRAVGYIILGLAAKVLLADTLNTYLKPFVRSPGDLDIASSLYVLFGYSFQIYFDFYGYSLIALGLALLFGFVFPTNFLRPYGALNPRDFWRRWHVTLSSWLRDYLYIPLGGNQRYRRNILIVFAACGLWHGAGWTFIVWGLYHAVLIIGYIAMRPMWDRVPAILQIAVTFILVSLGWSLFQFDFAHASLFFASLAGLGTGAVPPPTLEMWLAVAAGFAITYGLHIEAVVDRIDRGLGSAISYGIQLALLASLVLMFIDRSEGFIYFRF